VKEEDEEDEEEADEDEDEEDDELDDEEAGEQGAEVPQTGVTGEVQRAPTTQLDPAPATHNLSKKELKERKKKELEEIEKILMEFGVTGQCLQRDCA
jgi:hypothetical protein